MLNLNFSLNLIVLSKFVPKEANQIGTTLLIPVLIAQAFNKIPIKTIPLSIPLINHLCFTNLNVKNLYRNNPWATKYFLNSLQSPLAIYSRWNFFVMDSQFNPRIIRIIGYSDLIYDFPIVFDQSKYSEFLIRVIRTMY